MPQAPVDPKDLANQFFAGGGTALSSTSTSATGYNKWFTHYQVMWGMWKRMWSYDCTNLATVGGATSGPPSVAFTYLDVNVNTKVIEATEVLNWASGVQINQEIQLSSNSALSGGGTLGSFWTIVAGYWRAPWVIGNSDDNCERTFNVPIAKAPGPYIPGDDTREKFIADFNSGVTLNIPRSCPRFQPDIVYT